MRQIGTIGDETTANQLVDYLLTLGITARVDGNSEGWAVWVHNEDRLAQARAELREFISNPSAPKYQGASTTARELRRQADRIDREHLRNTLDVRHVWSARDFRRCPVTWSLIVLCMGVTLATNFGNTEAVTRPLQFARYAQRDLSTLPPDRSAPGPVNSEGGYWIDSNPLADLKHGEVWRLLTPTFLHFGPLHVAFNLSMLYLLGTSIERRKGPWRLLLLVLVSAIASNLGQYLYTRSPLFGGISGVNLALFGYVWMKGLYDPEEGLGLSTGTVMFVVLYLAFTIVADVPYLGHAAHLVGLATGVLIGVAPHLIAPVPEPSE